MIDISQKQKYTPLISSFFDSFRLFVSTILLFSYIRKSNYTAINLLLKCIDCSRKYIKLLYISSLFFFLSFLPIESDCEVGTFY